MPRKKKSTSRKILLDEKILNQKLNRNLKKLNTEQNNFLKQNKQKKKRILNKKECEEIKQIS
jgi:hypothetical protein